MTKLYLSTQLPFLITTLPFLLLLLTQTSSTTTTYQPPNNNPPCSCWTDYQPEYTKTGPQCVSDELSHIMPCNMTHPPNCRCSGNGSSILKDRTGTWCTKYRRGEELLRWPCENREDWVEFFQRHPDLFKN